MKIWLLTHSEERKKASGTGKLVKAQLAKNCDIIEWSRTQPNSTLANLPAEDTVLIYLDNETSPEHQKIQAKLAKHVIIIDATWQQAKKIFNRTPYLHKFQRYQIRDAHSQYSKRRNQVEGGLCTAETAIHMMALKGHPQTDALQAAFDTFNQ
ncbi:DTW domain-containing protein [Marinomonas epiphytica]